MFDLICLNWMAASNQVGTGATQKLLWNAPKILVWIISVNSCIGNA